MKISDLVGCPQWLLNAKTENADVEITRWGWVIWKSGYFLGGDFLGGDFRGGDFLGGDFRGGNFWGGNFWGGNFWRGNFRGGDFLGGNFRGGSVEGNAALKLRAHIGLYPYQVTAALLADGSRWVQMGCLWKSLEDWETVGIRKSNESEFPDDGSEKCEERVAAFEFAKAAALRMK